MRRGPSGLICLSIIITSLCMVSCGKSEESNPQESSIDASSSFISKADYTIPADDDFSTSDDPNGTSYNIDNVERIDSPLRGKTIYWLGSSVTYGASSNGVAMSEYLSALTGCECKKDAVSGTTILCDNQSENTGTKSYVSRLMNSTIFDRDEKIDAFVCQISTNDCVSSRLSKRGVITGDDYIDINDFNKKTTLGGVETIIAYVIDTWGCPIYFYSGSYFSDGSNKSQRQNNDPKGSEYATLVSQVKQISDKWNEYLDFHVEIIDLFNDQEFNQLASDKYYSWAMNDPIHPKKAAYLQWWTPYFVQRLENDLSK